MREAKGLPNSRRVSVFGADPIDGRRKVVGQDQYPSMGRFRKPPLVAMGGPGSSLGETRERPLILCGLKRGIE